MSACTHASTVAKVTPSADGCGECAQRGDRWVHLRLCMICGHVGCCDSSKNRHATAHFRATGHAVMKAFEPGQDWGWCYIDEVELDGSVWAVEGPRAHS
ncbi:MAG TPA: UBP-type zinc finger domain-containing protein [Candidatus Dormibacteraeota bacterium]|nr:UBP-type zinc finger domain-containing protein [Candidatus Dormibacteraeota bacterium]